MPIGTLKASNEKRAVCLMDTATANVNPPTLATDGVPCYPDYGSDAGVDKAAFFLNRDARESTLMISGTCTAGQVLTGTFTLWGYLALSGVWYEIPLNGGNAITPTAMAETDTDKITFTQRLQNLGHFDRLALDLQGIGGGGAQFSAYLVTGISGTAA